MYCSECGKEVKKGAKFCGECGAKVEKKLDLKFDKKMIAIISIIVVVIGLFLYGKITTSPKYVANRYIKAIINKDSNVLYGYLDVDGDKTFIKKSIFKKLIENELKNNNIENYKINDVTYGIGNLSAKVGYSYTIKGSSNERSRFITLNKDKDKKYIFFDNWNVAEFEKANITLNDFKVIVPKDSKVVYEGIKVSNKYLDKNSSTENTDVYVLPIVFTAKTDIEVTLTNGLKTKETIKPGLFTRQYRFKVTTSSLNEKDTKKITSVVKENLELIYNSAIENKTFADIKSNFKVKDLTDLETNYNSFSKSLNSFSNILKKISFNDIQLSNISMDSDGNLRVSVKAKFDYTVEYKIGDEVKTNDNNSSSYFTLVFKVENKDYVLTKFSSLKTYFYR